MLYNEGDLTIRQAEEIIGKKMVERIKYLNDWAAANGYKIMLHSTFMGAEKDIFAEGLKYPTTYSYDSRDEILEDSNVSENDLKMLEEGVKNNGGKQKKLSKLYETYLPSKSDTVKSYMQISAKDLLEYNHKGGDITIILCVPIKRIEKIGRDSKDPFSAGTTKGIDPYLRREIQCRQSQDGNFEYRSKYSYPTQGILCVFDRDNNKIKFNSQYDETFYLDSRTPQTGEIKKGILSDRLKSIGQKPLQNDSLGTDR